MGHPEPNSLSRYQLIKVQKGHKQNVIYLGGTTRRKIVFRWDRCQYDSAIAHECILTTCFANNTENYRWNT